MGGESGSFQEPGVARDRGSGFSAFLILLFLILIATEIKIKKKIKITINTLPVIWFNQIGE